jgi:hypothetical protein
MPAAWCRDGWCEFGSVLRRDDLERVMVIGGGSHAGDGPDPRRVSPVPQAAPFAASDTPPPAPASGRACRGGARSAPAEVRDGVVAACDRPALEPRARYPLARGQPVRMARRVRRKLELVVEHVDGRRHLPIVSLRQAA